jgi:uncharacterized protein (UPF0335 family)
MFYKYWAYFFASIGIIIGIYSIKNKKWKIASWIICFSLLIFIGGNVQLGDINSFIDNSFNITKRFKDVESSLENLNLEMNQVLALKQDISQTVNLITKVEKEIADIKETIKQFYSYFKGELFSKEDIDKRVKIFHSGKFTVIYFQLETIPIKESVILTHQNGTSSPATYSISHNTISYRTKGKIDNILKDEDDFYYIKYFQDFNSKEELVTLEGMVYKGTPEEPDLALLKKSNL